MLLTDDYRGIMAPRSKGPETVAAFVNKAEPSAADMDHLRHRLTDEQRSTLRSIVDRGRRDFDSQPLTDQDDSL